MNTQEMPIARQAYEHPWTESVRLHVENVICNGSPTGPSINDSDDNDG